MFIAIEGIDGAGKSTQVRILKDYIESRGVDVVTCRDPGSTKLGEEVRNLLLNKKSLDINPRCELFLFMAARVQMITEIIEPALKAGKTVISDRFLLSSIVYQGYALGSDTGWIWDVLKRSVSSCYPDLTIVLDVATETTLARIGSNPDRIESGGKKFFEKVRMGFIRGVHEWAYYFPDYPYDNYGYCEIVPANGPPDEVAETIREYYEYYK